MVITFFKVEEDAQKFFKEGKSKLIYTSSNHIYNSFKGSGGGDIAKNDRFEFPNPCGLLWSYANFVNSSLDRDLKLKLRERRFWVCSSATSRANSFLLLSNICGTSYVNLNDAVGSYQTNYVLGAGLPFGYITDTEYKTTPFTNYGNLILYSGEDYAHTCYAAEKITLI